MLKSSKKKAETTVNGMNEDPAEKRQAYVAETAYFLAEKRGFAPGGDLEDWFTAEEMVAKGA